MFKLIMHCLIKVISDFLCFNEFILCFNRLRRPIGKFTVQEQKLEGDYRYVNSRLITNRSVSYLGQIGQCLIQDK
jgi:ABC-type uncharacterized transport system fused permease/ATPase subunit